MTQINTNVPSMLAQRILRSQSRGMVSALERLSTGLRINRGADDPAGLIASENLRAEKVGISTAIDNAERASNILGTAEGGLNEVSALLVELQGLVGQSANSGGLSPRRPRPTSSRSTRSWARSTASPSRPASRARSCSTATTTTRPARSAPPR